MLQSSRLPEFPRLRGAPAWAGSLSLISRVQEAHHQRIHDCVGFMDARPERREYAPQTPYPLIAVLRNSVRARIAEHVTSHTETIMVAGRLLQRKQQIRHRIEECLCETQILAHTRLFSFMTAGRKETYDTNVVWEELPMPKPVVRADTEKEEHPPATTLPRAP